jgi:hypothetical protein
MNSLQSDFNVHSIEFTNYVTLGPLFYNASILSLNYITNLFIKGCTWVLMVRLIVLVKDLL